MIGTSLLIILEGDPQVLEKSLLRVIQSSDDESTTNEEEEEDEDDSDDEEGNAREESLIPFEIKLIDFAHTTISEEGGDDDKERGGNEISEGVLTGVENLREGLRRLVERLENEEKEKDKGTATRN